jgi:hypothetical protein
MTSPTVAERSSSGYKIRGDRVGIHDVIPRSYLATRNMILVANATMGESYPTCACCTLQKALLCPHSDA